jgi:hypothetical protein
MNLYGFWAAIDISENIQRGLGAIKGIKGLNALILLLALGAINYGLFWLVLFFDVGATLEWTERAAFIIAPTVPPEFGQYTSYLILSITLLPTLIELFAARFAAAGLHIAAGLVFAFSLFDAVTDWPRVVLFMDAYREAFNALGVLSWPAFQITRLLWLFMATFGFEALFVVFLVLFVLAIVLRSLRSGAPP